MGASSTEALSVRVETAAKLLDTSERTVTWWIRTGKLPATKIGRSWRIPMAAVAKLATATQAVV